MSFGALLVSSTQNAGCKLRPAQEQFFQVPTLPEETRWLHESLLKKKQPELCFGCHMTIQAKFALPTHHRVPEGLMKCTDCHSPHGTLNASQLKKVNFEVCVSCHTEKRGPLVYEHPALRVEGCTACHSPHGTVERHLLCGPRVASSAFSATLIHKRPTCRTAGWVFRRSAIALVAMPSFTVQI